VPDLPLRMEDTAEGLARAIPALHISAPGELACGRKHKRRNGPSTLSHCWLMPASRRGGSKRPGTGRLLMRVEKWFALPVISSLMR
jgi:hypothetical protein